MLYNDFSEIVSAVKSLQCRSSGNADNINHNVGHGCEALSSGTEELTMSP